MAKRSRTPVAAQVLGTGEGSVLDVIDHLLNKGVMATGDVTLGVAGVDLVYLRLSALLCAADRLMPRTRAGAAQGKRSRSPRSVRRARR